MPSVTPIPGSGGARTSGTLSAATRPVNTPSPGLKPPKNPAAYEYQSSYSNRRERQDLRARQRWGDWGILDVATSILWLQEECVLTTGDPSACAAAPIVDLWP